MFYAAGCTFLLNLLITFNVKTKSIILDIKGLFYIKHVFLSSVSVW